VIAPSTGSGQASGLTPFEVEERRAGIGGTDAKRIMGGDWESVVLEKLGLIEPDDLSDNLRVQLGLFTQPFNQYWCEKQTGRPITRVGERAIHPDIPYMIANLDGVTTTSKGYLAYWDAKHVAKTGDDVVARYTPQMTHCALVIGVEWWVISFLIGNSRWEFVEQEVDPFFASELLAKEKEFWGYVERGEVPPPMPGTAPPKPVRLREISLDDADYREGGWPNWGSEMVKLLGDFGSVRDAWVRANIVRDAIKELLPDDVGLVTRGLWKITRNRAGSVTIGLRKQTDTIGVKDAGGLHLRQKT